MFSHFLFPAMKPKSEELTRPTQYGLVVLLNINNFTQHQHQMGPLWPQWTKTKTKPLCNHVWTYTKFKKIFKTQKWLNIPLFGLIWMTAVPFPATALALLHSFSLLGKMKLSVTDLAHFLTAPNPEESRLPWTLSQISKPKFYTKSLLTPTY